MAIKIGINGFGRIGRLTFRAMFGQGEFEIIGINDLTPASTLAHLLQYDSAQGRYKVGEISASNDELIVGKKKIKVFQEKDPEKLPWKSLGVDLVIESTGFFVSEEGAKKHLKAGAKKVVISAPAKGEIKTIVYGVNHKTISPSDQIISGASCTTNCLAPVVDVLNKAFGLKQGFMTTVHAFTNDQRTVDAPHSDLRRARAASYNIIPTSTGAAAAVGKVLPELKGKLDGIAMRVPTITGSVVDLVFKLEKSPTCDEINDVMKKSASNALAYSEVPIVSTDIIGETHGSIFDATQTKVMETNGEKLFKVIMWYDNEMSYVNQLVRTSLHFAKIK